MEQKAKKVNSLPTDPKGLEDFVSGAEPEQLLETLRDAADFLYERAGTPAHWYAVANSLNKAAIGLPGNAITEPEVKSYVGPIWEVQRAMSNLHFILFDAKHEDKIKGIYEKVTGKKANGNNAQEFSTYYDQLNNIIDNVTSIMYGQNRQGEGGKVFEFSYYANQMFLLKHLLQVGPFDWRSGRRHNAIVEKAMMAAGMPKSDGDQMER